MDRFDKFTDRARKVLTLAQDEAQRFNHNYIGTEHLLLGLVREGEGVAARVLENMNVELSKVRTAVEFIIGRGTGRSSVTSGSRRARSASSSWRSTRRAAWATTTSGPSTCCSGSSARARASPAGVLESLGVNLDKVATR
jgi:ATP-dependent Clp protease ATP-binding subunit ClpC